MVASGEGSGVAGTSYTLTCTVSLPSGVAVPDSIDIQWLGLPPPQIEMTSPEVYIATLDIMLQKPTGYTCTASYTVNGVSSKLVQDRIDIGESMCPSSLFHYLTEYLQWLVRYQWSWLVQVPGKWVQPYTLTCTVALFHRASDSSVSILWEGPSTHQQTVDTTDR